MVRISTHLVKAVHAGTEMLHPVWTGSSYCHIYRRLMTKLDVKKRFNPGVNNVVISAVAEEKVHEEHLNTL